MYSGVTEFRLRFPAGQIGDLANRYSDSADDLIERVLAPRIKKMGFLRKPDFIRLCRWKTPRSRRHVQKNSDAFIRAVTQTAFSTTDERLRIEVLTLLDGVDWPTASVILHFGHRDPYPILDVRAVWSLGIDKPPKYDFRFWQAYTRFCRTLSKKSCRSLRTLDKALWQYSKENQESAVARPGRPARANRKPAKSVKGDL
ncbi:MAG TPA: hypothetical protein VLO07_02390 [Thermoanaerobaculia bacterium]|nr:hypothetical protein [Thermoanaerobaculia bacterium]